MKFLKLTSESSCFNLKRNKDTITMSWFTTLDLSHVKTIGLNMIQIYPILSQNTDFCITIYSNLIQRTECNPTGEIAMVHIGKKHVAIANQTFTGTNYYEYITLCLF